MRDLRTEIPDDWSERKLNSVIRDLSAGISVNSGDRPALKKEMGVLKTSSLNKGNFISTENKVILEDGEKERAKRNPKEGTILVSRMNTPELVGEIAYVDKDYPNLYLPDRIWITEGIDTDEVNSRWLSYKLTSPEVRHNLKSIATGTSGSMKNITQNDFLKLPIAFPSKHEQDEMVKIISSWDEAISKTEKLIETKKRYKKGLMQRLLSGKVRFPEFEGEDWVEVKLKEIFTRIRDKNEGEADNILTISSKGGFLDQTDKFGGVIAGKNLENYTYIERGDFAYNKGNSLTYPQGCIFKLEDYDHAAVPNVYYCFQAKNKSVYTDFYKYYFELGLLNRQLSRVINKGVRNDGLLNLSAKDFFNIKVQKPPHNEQKKIAGAIAPFDEEIELLNTKLRALKKQKKGLMQQLLTGKVRVKV